MTNIDKKKAIVEGLVSKMNNSHFYITDAQGLSVNSVNKLRFECYKKNIHYQVVKNTLLSKVLFSLSDQSLGENLLKEEVLKGFSSVFITQKSPSDPAKIIKNFQKADKSLKPVLKGAVVDGSLYIGALSLDELSKIKTKEVLIGELVSLLKSPTQHVIASLQGAQSKLGGIVKALHR